MKTTVINKRLVKQVDDFQMEMVFKTHYPSYQRMNTDTQSLQRQKFELEVLYATGWRDK